MYVFISVKCLFSDQHFHVSSSDGGYIYLYEL